MTDQKKRHEIVGLLASKDRLDACMKALLDAGFDHSDISLLSSHETPDVAQGDRVKDMEETATTALDIPMTYAFPLATAGLIAVVGGPITAILGGIIATGMVGMAAKDYIEALVSHPKPGEFARALEAGGVILWVYAENPEQETLAASILEKAGATNIHASLRKD